MISYIRYAMTEERLREQHALTRLPLPSDRSREIYENWNKGERTRRKIPGAMKRRRKHGGLEPGVRAGMPVKLA
jgi:hypothetical protein